MDLGLTLIPLNFESGLDTKKYIKDPDFPILLITEPF